MILFRRLILILSVTSSVFTLEPFNLVVVILSQNNAFNNRLSENLKASLTRENVKVEVVPHDWDHVGAWTIIPILQGLAARHSHNASWIFFCEDTTSVHMPTLLKAVSELDGSEEQWFGYALHDLEPTIIHHFAFAEDPVSFSYPLFAAGFLISKTLLNKLAQPEFQSEHNKSDFAIDPAHELALFVGTEHPLIHRPNTFCSDHASGCASYPTKDLNCGKPLANDHVFFAVKTCSKFHDVRIPVVQQTWGREAKHIEYFSDVANSSIPTTKVGVRNTERGHCAKTMRILKLSLERASTLGDIQWIILTDDDTIISVPRLLAALACFPTNGVVGERYGYNVHSSFGYNYITGGGGIAFGISSLSTILENCHCPQPSSPDDMMIGHCLSHLPIPLIHSPLFHQARPMDYSPGYLAAHEPLSFHKHWMIDPVAVYNTWFNNALSSHQHNEL